jgi:NTP pyrophosphatase (non-canonical NTP hydrolase)
MTAPYEHILAPDAIHDAGELLQNQCHGASHSAGWWIHRSSGTDLAAVVRGDAEPRGMTADWVPLLIGALVSQKLMLSVTELAEAMEGHRKGLKDDKLPHRSMLEVELADTVIRVFDLAGALNMDLGKAIAEKMAFNAIRPDHKPEARAAAGGKAY